jgi:hypothetical protein
MFKYYTEGPPPPKPEPTLPLFSSSSDKQLDPSDEKSAAANEGGKTRATKQQPGKSPTSCVEHVVPDDNRELLGFLSKLLGK